MHAMASVRAVENALQLEIRSTPSTSGNMIMLAHAGA